MTTRNPLRHSRPRTRDGCTSPPMKFGSSTSLLRRADVKAAAAASCAFAMPMLHVSDHSFFFSLEYTMRVCVSRKKLIRHHRTHGFRAAGSLADWIMASNPTGWISTIISASPAPHRSLRQERSVAGSDRVAATAHERWVGWSEISARHELSRRHTPCAERAHYCESSRHFDSGSTSLLVRNRRR